MARCQSCGAEIRWAETPGGKWIPLDAEPVSDGNVVVRETDGVPEAVVVAKTAGRYVSHFATCPNAKGHRR